MKKILIIPIKTSGVIDIRQTEYYIFNNVQYLQQIQANIIKMGKKILDYKFCQFEETDIIPFFVNIKDRLSQEVAEFEIERVKFIDIPTDEETKKNLIEEIYLKPLDDKMRELIYKTTYWIASERLGEKINEDEFINLRIQKEELDKNIKAFDYKQYLNEIA